MKTPNTPPVFVVITFDRKLNIVPGDFSDFLTLYSPNQFCAERLREGYDSVLFQVSGYDDDPRELPEITEVRAFFQRLHHAWPYFAFFASTMCENSLLFMSCVMSDTCVQRNAGAQKFRMTFPADEALILIAQSMFASQMLFARAGITADRQEERIRDLSSHYNVLNG